MKSSAHTVPVAFLPPTNFTITLNAVFGRTVCAGLFVSATNPVLEAVVWFTGSFVSPMNAPSVS